MLPAASIAPLRAAAWAALMLLRTGAGDGAGDGGDEVSTAPPRKKARRGGREKKRKSQAKATQAGAAETAVAAPPSARIDSTVSATTVIPLLEELYSRDALARGGAADGVPDTAHRYLWSFFFDRVESVRVAALQTVGRLLSAARSGADADRHAEGGSGAHAQRASFLPPRLVGPLVSELLWVLVVSERDEEADAAVSALVAVEWRAFEGAVAGLLAWLDAAVACDANVADAAAFRARLQEKRTDGAAGDAHDPREKKRNRGGGVQQAARAGRSSGCCSPRGAAREQSSDDRAASRHVPQRTRRRIAEGPFFISFVCSFLLFAHYSFLCSLHR